MDKESQTVAERILNLALQVICLLTGESFPAVKPGDVVTITVPPPESLTVGSSNDKLILDVTNKIIELLAGEVHNGAEEVEVSLSLEQIVLEGTEKTLEKDTLVDSEQISGTEDMPESADGPVDPSISVPTLDCGNEGQTTIDQEDEVSAMCDPIMSKLDLNAAMDFSSCDEGDLSDGDLPVAPVNAQLTPVCITESHTVLVCTDSLQSGTAVTSSLPSAATPTDQEESPTDQVLLTPVEPECIPSTAISICQVPSSSTPPDESTCADQVPHTTAESDNIQSITTCADQLQTATTHLVSIQSTCTSVVPVPSLAAQPNCTQPTTTCLVQVLPTTVQPSSTQSTTTAVGHVLPITVQPNPTQCVTATLSQVPLISMQSNHVQATPTLVSPLPPHKVGPNKNSMFTDIVVIQTPPTESTGTVGAGYVHSPPAESETDGTDVKKSSPTRFIDSATGLLLPPSTEIDQAPSTSASTGQNKSRPPVKKRVLSTTGNGEQVEVWLSQDNKPMCPDCGKCFRWHSEVLCHKRKHTGEKPYCCSKCGQCFSRIPHLVIHERSHTGERPYICSECKKCFSSKSELNEHRKRHRGLRIHPCPDCTKSFITKSDLAKHKRSHTGEKPHPCSICGKCFTLRSGVVRHERTHTGERPYSCTECGKAYSSNSELINHMRTHTGERPFSCLDCGKSFYCSSDLMKHRRCHSSERPHLCSICGKSYTSKSVLYRHQKIHTKVKAFTCNLCGKSFSKEKTLENHQKVHKKVKPHCCEQCGKCFYRPCALSKHMKNTHQVQDSPVL
ncbi:uncharacterized protein [Hyperolius riggenbachi]|uniref:uncharacterized protein isoform X1 n=2 Tax=Hyperolius riggenbachi TaxID=752182 RepID=UPI0035A30C63